MAVNLPKIVETPNFSRYCKSAKEIGNVTMTFPVNLSHGCFRTAALLMVTLNMDSRKLIGRVYPENCFKNAKPVGVKGLKVHVVVVMFNLAGQVAYQIVYQLHI